MIRSMTGFGVATADVNGTHYAVEVRSLNNRYFKTTLRLPEELQGLEAELESLLSRRLNRGSVVLTVRYSDTSADAAATINGAAVQRYLEQLLAVAGMEHGSARVDLSTLLSLPGVLVTDTGEHRLEKARDPLLDLVSSACDRVVAMRSREGQSVYKDLSQHLDSIGKRLSRIAERAPHVVDEFQNRLESRINGLLSQLGQTVGKDEVLREVAIFAERSDIAEEVSRLSAHLEQFREILEADTETPAGRTLDFIAQEMLREANTIGSKSSDAEISKLTVEVKGIIDRIKEQAQNVE